MTTVLMEWPVESRKEPRQQLHLVCDVVSARTNLILYTIRLMPLYDHEADLCAGRFAHFDKKPQQYGLDFEWRPDQYEEMVNWIAEQADSPWNICVRSASVNDTVIRFSFDNPVTGVAFALVFK